MVAVTDAKGHLNTQTWLAGSTADDQQITAEFHADGGVRQAGLPVIGSTAPQ